MAWTTIMVWCLLTISCSLLLYDQQNDNKIQLSSLINRLQAKGPVPHSKVVYTGPSIYYVHRSIETWNQRQLCAIESSAVHHPRSLITIYTTAPPHPSLSTWTNVHVTPLDLVSAYQGTPMEGCTDAAAGFPLALLWKHGGIYLDRDFVVVRPLYQLMNSISLEWDGFDFVSSTGLLAFLSGHPFVWSLMSQLATSTSLSISRLLHRRCWKSLVDNAESCDGATVLPFNLTHPHLPSLTDNDMWSNVLTVHLAAEKMKNLDGRLIDGLYRQNCPLTYQEMLKSSKNKK